eukprot:1336616-Ditylum_brightwellii.AAC.1
MNILYSELSSTLRAIDLEGPTETEGEYPDTLEVRSLKKMHGGRDLKDIGEYPGISKVTDLKK